MRSEMVEEWRISTLTSDERWEIIRYIGKALIFAGVLGACMVASFHDDWNAARAPFLAAFHIVCLVPSAYLLWRTIFVIGIGGERDEIVLRTLRRRYRIKARDIRCAKERRDGVVCVYLASGRRYHLFVVGAVGRRKLLEWLSRVGVVVAR